MRKSETSIHTQFSLLCGQIHGEQLQRGTVIRVISGTAQVSSRVWLEHSSWAGSTLVHEGGVFCVQASGWFELSAHSQVQVCLERPTNTFWNALKACGHSLSGITHRQEKIVGSAMSSNHVFL